MSKSKRGSLAAVLVAVLAGGALGVAHLVNANADGCSTNGVHLVVAVAPDIAPSVTAAAAKWQHTSPTVSGHCVSVDVASQRPADTALALLSGSGGALSTGPLPSAPPTGATASGTSAPAATPIVPAVWIPDSTSWLDRVTGQLAGVFAGSAPSLASSPVVLGVEHADAARLNMTKGTLSMGEFASDVVNMRNGDLAGAQTGHVGFFQLGLTEPRQDSAGLAGATLLAGLDSASGDKDSQFASLVADYRIASPASNQSTDSAGLINAFTNTNKADNLLGLHMTVGVLSEQAIVAYDATSPTKPIDAVRLDEGLGALNYPIALTSKVSTLVGEAATLFQSAMTNPIYRPIYAAAGFRTPDGVAATGFPSAHGATSTTAHIQPILGDNNSSSVLAVWAAANTASRVLVLIDEDSSMGASTGGKTRMQVTQEAASTGLALFTPDSELGNWFFAPGLGSKSYKENVPVAGLNEGGGAQRVKIGNSIMSATPTGQSGCGLYPALDAAYRNMLDNYAVGRINIIVAFTDCASAEPGGMSLESLTNDLQGLADVNRPIPLVLINVATSTSDPNLKAITPNLTTIANSVGGNPYPLTKASDIVGVFLKALVAVGS